MVLVRGASRGPSWLVRRCVNVRWFIAVSVVASFAVSVTLLLTVRMVGDDESVARLQCPRAGALDADQAVQSAGRAVLRQLDVALMSATDDKRTVRYDRIRYDTRCYFNVRSRADMSQFNLPHGTDN